MCYYSSYQQLHKFKDEVKYIFQFFRTFDFSECLKYLWPTTCCNIYSVGQSLVVTSGSLPPKSFLTTIQTTIDISGNFLPIQSTCMDIVYPGSMTGEHSIAFSIFPFTERVACQITLYCNGIGTQKNFHIRERDHIPATTELDLFLRREEESRTTKMQKDSKKKKKKRFPGINVTRNIKNKKEEKRKRKIPEIKDNI